MNNINKNNRPTHMSDTSPGNDNQFLESALITSWSRVAPFWPLKNLIAVNPIAGFEDLPFEKALNQAQAYFQQKEIPKEMLEINRESIKWLQVFFDEGQSTLHMPNKHLGFLHSMLSLIPFDKHLHKNNNQKLQWLKNLPSNSLAIISKALLYLHIPAEEQEQFLTLMLTTLPGWAAHIKYRTNWVDEVHAAYSYSVTQCEYVAFRLILTCLLWPKAHQLLAWHQQALQQAHVKKVCDDIATSESDYQENLLRKIIPLKKAKPLTNLKAQLVFCIDVRSEPFRRALEAQGAYETYGFAGFFGLPISIENNITGERHISCPILLKPTHHITEDPDFSYQSCQKGYRRLQSFKKIYQSMKNTFTTPFSLVEAVGIINGFLMVLKSISPKITIKIQSSLKKAFAPSYNLTPNITTISLEEQISYGENALRMMGLTELFAPLVIFCGHGSTTKNNAYATALDCGACGGHHGAPNARILAAILNRKDVRQGLSKNNINIPNNTLFVAARHDTTTDEIELFTAELTQEKTKQITALKQDLQEARNENSLWRTQAMDIKTSKKRAHKVTAARASDWAQVRPEWGLAKNASFVVGPRQLTQDINLEGRSFLHSYDWQKDADLSILTTILTAPMIVAQWINAQYLFSTLDNVAFGSGSKITKNITGKIGTMQGNASDLMHGLPLQSVYKSDKDLYHNPMRLSVIVYAPQKSIDQIIQQHEVLQKLFGNGWIHLICIDPEKEETFKLQRSLEWTKI